MTQDLEVDPVDSQIGGRVFQFLVMLRSIGRHFYVRKEHGRKHRANFESTFHEVSDRVTAFSNVLRAAAMLSKFERYSLTFGPSPIEPLRRLFAHLGGAPPFDGYSDTVCNG